jgi:hypothetical protein
MRTESPPRRAIDTWPRSFGVTIGGSCWISRRWFGVSMNPPVPILLPSAKRSRPASSAVEVDSIACSSVMPCCRIRFGSTSTWYCFRCSPQMATFATPGTRSRRALTFQYAIIERSVIGTVFEDMPIFRTRDVVDVAGMMNGGAAQVGSDGVTAVTRSWTSCRTFRRSVPGLKSSSIDDS